MAKTGSALFFSVAFLTGAVALAAAGEPEVSMSVDRTKVGTEDTFRVDVVVRNAPDGASLAFPSSADFEILSRSESTEMSYSLGSGGGAALRQLRRYSLVMRANRVGRLTISPATLKTKDRTYLTESIAIEVVTGRTKSDRPQQPRAQSPFGPGSPFGGVPPGFPNFDDDPFDEEPAAPDKEEGVVVPRGDSDLFLRAVVDKTEAFVGEQIMLSITIYARVDLASVDTVTMPKFEGFWTQDIQTPSQLQPEAKIVDGVPYRAYVLRQKAIFAMKPGETTIEAAEADINTGFLFSGRRVHRKSNALKLKIKPLPGNTGVQNVGQWRLTMQPVATEVTLGEPIQVKVQLDGRGYLQGVQVPPLQVPAGLKKFDPQTSDKVTVSRSGFVSGTRIVEYVMVPQQTGTFTLPGLTLEYFDPEAKHFEASKTDAVTITVKPGANGQTSTGISTAAGAADPSASSKNQLVAGGLRALRASANFSAPSVPVWQRGFFVPVAVAPLALSMVMFALVLVRGALRTQSPQAQQKAQARAAQKRLEAARRLLETGATAVFYEEVERALRSFLEAKLKAPTMGLTRDALDAVMASHDVPESERARIVAVFERCDLGRYAPGMGESGERHRTLDDAAAAMEAWS